MLNALATHLSFWNKITASYGVMRVTQIKILIEDVTCDS